jgi:hypothetical protein
MRGLYPPWEAGIVLRLGKIPMLGNETSIAIKNTPGRFDRTSLSLSSKDKPLDYFIDVLACVAGL